MYSAALMSIASNAIALFLLWLFLSAGLHKIRPANTAYYATVFANYGVSSRGLARLLPNAMGFLEIAIGILVVVPGTRIYGMLAIVTVLLIYLLLMARQLWLGKQDIACGCAGPLGDTKISTWLLLRNAALIALAFFCVAPAGSHGAQYAGLIFMFALLLVLLYLSAEQLLSNGQKLQRLTNR